MLRFSFAGLNGLPVYSDIGARVLANYTELVRSWPAGNYGIPDIETYLGMQEMGKPKNPGKLISYDEFRSLFKTNQILFYKDNPSNVDAASIGVLFIERENMQRIMESSEGNGSAHKKSLAAYGTLCRLDDADYAYARLADLPNRDGFLEQSLRIASQSSDRVTFAYAAFDPAFMPAYMAAKKEIDAEIAAMVKPVSSWRVPNAGRHHS